MELQNVVGVPYGNHKLKMIISQCHKSLKEQDLCKSTNSEYDQNVPRSEITEQSREPREEKRYIGPNGRSSTALNNRLIGLNVLKNLGVFQTLYLEYPLKMLGGVSNLILSGDTNINMAYLVGV